MTAWQRHECLRDLPNCGVVACAVAANVPVWRAMEWFQRNKRQNWKGATYRKERNDFLREHGIKFAVTRYPAAKRCTLARFVARRTKPGTLYMVDVSGHTAVVIDGLIIDQNETAPAVEHDARRQRVQRVVEIRNWCGAS